MSRKVLFDIDVRLCHISKCVSVKETCKLGKIKGPMGPNYNLNQSLRHCKSALCALEQTFIVLLEETFKQTTKSFQ